MGSRPAMCSSGRAPNSMCRREARRNIRRCVERQTGCRDTDNSTLATACASPSAIPGHGRLERMQSQKEGA